MHTGIDLDPRMHTGILYMTVPVCIWGSLYAYGDHQLHMGISDCIGQKENTKGWFNA
jgi:hypothetical protein